MESLMTLVLVSSPSPSHPSTLLIQKCLDSILQCLPEVCSCKVLILLDGYKLVPSEQLRPKSGKIDRELEEKYNGYHANLEALFASSAYSANSPQIYRSPVHLGFANCVKAGLEMLTTPYCLVCQHDRKFIRKFPFISSIIDAFERHQQIRYVGFPSINNSKINITTRAKYLLDHLNGPSFRINLHLKYESSSNFSEKEDFMLEPDNYASPPGGGRGIVCACHSDSGNIENDAVNKIGDNSEIHSDNSNVNSTSSNIIKGNNIFLQPLIFWYDSQHICHVKRYLEIYRPFTNIPTDLKRVFGTPAVKKMIMRNGDFIEDRFGQMQRNVLARLAKTADEGTLGKAFNWFGCYLLWEQDKLYDAGSHRDALSVSVSVSESEYEDESGHNRGRSNAYSEISSCVKEVGTDDKDIEIDIDVDIDAEYAESGDELGIENQMKSNISHSSSSSSSSSAVIIDRDTSLSTTASDVLVLASDEVVPKAFVPSEPVTGVFIDPLVHSYCSHTTAVYVQHMDGRKYDQDRVDLFNKMFNKNISI